MTSIVTVKVLKMYQLVINLEFLGTGVIYCFIGAFNFVFAHNMKKTLPLNSLSVVASSIMMMCLGVMIVSVVIFGAYRSHKVGKFLSTTYALMLVFVILIQLTIASVLHIDQNNEITTKRISDEFKDFFGKNNKTVEEELDCCKVDGCIVDGSHIRGCLFVLLDAIKGQKQGLLYLSLGFAYVHMLNLIFAGCIAKGNKNHHKT